MRAVSQRIVDPDPWSPTYIYEPRTLPFEDVLLVDSAGFEACAIREPGIPFCWRHTVIKDAGTTIDRKMPTFVSGLP